MNAPFERRSRTACWAGGLLWLVVAGAAQAQGLKPSGRLVSPATERAVQASQEPLTVDRIVAVVNSEPITQHDVRRRLERVTQQTTRIGRPLPPREELTRQVIESLVLERAQLQLAKEQGIKVENAAVDEAEQNIARQNQLSLDELHQQLRAEGLSPTEFRDNIRQQLVLQRLREREVEARVRVTELDIDRYLAQKSENPGDDLQLQVAQVLVAVPENASPARIEALAARAQTVADRARSGTDFASLVREYSDAPDRTQGGDLGLRPADRYPPLFVEATRATQPGGIAGPVRSGAGFHVLKVLDKRVAGLPDATVTQTRARHILLRPSAQLSEAEAVARLTALRARLVSGELDFDQAARDNSQDSSAQQGGDLGWAVPGMFVPEFEDTMNRLPLNALSQPLVSRFGVHLIQVLERKEVPVPVRVQREQVKQILRQQKADEALERWLEDVRAGAYVEYRDARP